MLGLSAWGNGGREKGDFTLGEVTYQLGRFWPFFGKTIFPGALFVYRGKVYKCD